MKETLLYTWNMADDLDEILAQFPDDLVSIIKTTSGKAVMLPKSASRLDPDQLEALRDLQRVGLVLRQLEDRADELAHECREMGISWALIGFCLGLTGQAAGLRYGER